MRKLASSTLISPRPAVVFALLCLSGFVSLLPDSVSVLIGEHPEHIVKVGLGVFSNYIPSNTLSLQCIRLTQTGPCSPSVLGVVTSGVVGFEPGARPRVARSVVIRIPVRLTAHCRSPESGRGGTRTTPENLRSAQNLGLPRIPPYRFGRRCAPPCTGVAGFEPAIERLGSSRPVH